MFGRLSLVSAVSMVLLLGLSPAVLAESADSPADSDANQHQHGMQMNPTPPYPQSPRDCSQMQIWDVGMAMCMPLPMSGMPMSMFMLSGSVFGGYVKSGGPRGSGTLYSTSMVMADLGTTVAERHYLNLDLMLTAERWTLPDFGYPLLLQIGEDRADGSHFLDAQHPHSSPIMGLTFSDTIRLSDRGNALKLSFAPRGETTEGPVAFMHRATGMINSDAPLGHHVGQDVGHISSTVIAGSLKIGKTRFEASTFHGAEPAPTKVDLPLGTPDSGAFRLVEELTPDLMAMASVAYVNQPEPDEPAIKNAWRYSASLYSQVAVLGDWRWRNSLIYGSVTRYEQADALHSFGEEFVFTNGPANLWGRVEVLQRTPAELHVGTAGNPDSPRWVTAATLGYTHYLVQAGGAALGLGGSVSKDFLPAEIAPAYGGSPWSGKIFLQLKGMRMWDL